MENKENIEKLIECLADINLAIDRDVKERGGCFMTPLQICHLEDEIFKISGIRLKITNIWSFKGWEKYYRTKLAEMS